MIIVIRSDLTPYSKQNTAAAMSFINELRKRKEENDSKGDEESADGTIQFKRVKISTKF